MYFENIRFQPYYFIHALKFKMIKTLFFDLKNVRLYNNEDVKTQKSGAP